MYFLYRDVIVFTRRWLHETGNPVPDPRTCSTAALSHRQPVQQTPAYTTTYTITVQEDGSALWQIEYRTLLATDSDLAAFDNYTRDLPSVYLPQVQDLMQRSAAQASVAASRPMAISNVTGNAVVQTSPTGRYGVVIYSFTWSAFAEPDGDLAVGDAFAGGLYLARDKRSSSAIPQAGPFAGRTGTG